MEFSTLPMSILSWSRKMSTMWWTILFWWRPLKPVTGENNFQNVYDSLGLHVTVYVITIFHKFLLLVGMIMRTIKIFTGVRFYKSANKLQNFKTDLFLSSNLSKWIMKCFAVCSWNSVGSGNLTTTSV